MNIREGPKYPRYLNWEDLKRYVRRILRAHHLTPKSVWVAGGFARGYGRRPRATPDIDIIFAIPESGPRQGIQQYRKAFMESEGFEGHPFHITLEYDFLVKHAHPEAKRLL